MKYWDAVFKKFPDVFWVVETYLVWSEDGWKKVHITAADCEFLASCNIKWN